MSDATGGGLATANDDATALADTLDRLTGASSGFGAALNGALRGAITQSRQLDDVLRGLGQRLVSNALGQALKPLTDLAGSSLDAGLRAALGFRAGGVLAGGAPVPFAAGGVVARPSYFPLGDGRTGLMGEAGPEAILPLARGADGRLGVAAGASAPVRVTVNITTPDIESFR
jgi:phage-related minor tail protein